MGRKKTRRRTDVLATEGRKKPKLVVVEDYGPTSETKRRLRPDIIETLWKRGTLDTHAWEAASEIRRIIEQIAGRFVRSSMGRLELMGGRIQSSPHPLDGVPLGLQSRYLHRYIPWTRRMGALKCGLATYMEITFAILVDGATPRQIERRHGLRSGRATEALIAALRSYR